MLNARAKKTFLPRLPKLFSDRLKSTQLTESGSTLSKNGPAEEYDFPARLSLTKRDFDDESNHPPFDSLWNPCTPRKVLSPLSHLRAPPRGERTSMNSVNKRTPIAATGQPWISLGFQGHHLSDCFAGRPISIPLGVGSRIRPLLEPKPMLLEPAPKLTSFVHEALYPPMELNGQHPKAQDAMHFIPGRGTRPSGGNNRIDHILRCRLGELGAPIASRNASYLRHGPHRPTMPKHQSIPWKVTSESADLG